MPRHWPTVEQRQAVSEEEWSRALHAAEHRQIGPPNQ
jgi:hypothetical protein